MFISLKQKATRKENLPESQYFGKMVKWPISVKKPDGSYYTAEESERLANGSKIKCDISVFTNDYGKFYSYVPSSLIVTEPVLKEVLESDFVESAPVGVQEPPTQVDPLDDEIPF